MSLSSESNESYNLDVIFNELFCAKGELNMIVAPKRMGKTSFALTMMAKGIFECDDGYLWLSSGLTVNKLIEMLNANLTKKILGQDCVYSKQNEFVTELIAGYEMEEMFHESNQIYNLDYIRNLISTKEEKYSVDCIIIDSIIQQDVSEKLNIKISNDFNKYLQYLKRLALELDKTIVLLYEINADGSPLMFTPEIVDTFCFIYRPEYYKIVEYNDGSSTLGDAHFIIMKEDECVVDQLLTYDVVNCRFY